MEKEKEADVLIYVMYTMFYVNDMACNCIFDLEPYVKEKDKETKKIYGALSKRAKRYRRNMRKLIGEKANFFLATHNSNMDDINQECIEEYRDSIIEAYYKGGITEYEFLGYLETARSLFYFSIEVIEYLVDKMVKEGLECRELKQYTLKPCSNIMDNLVKWCYRNAEKEVSDELDLTKDKEIMEWFGKINENALNYDVFLGCYEKAAKMCNDNIEC